MMKPKRVKPDKQITQSLNLIHNIFLFRETPKKKNHKSNDDNLFKFQSDKELKQSKSSSLHQSAHGQRPRSLR